MRTSKERENSFRVDLSALLTKHKAEIEITDVWDGYGMQEGVAVITMDSELNEGFVLISEYTEFKLDRGLYGADDLMKKETT
jgi:hypothetical protein